MSPAPLSFTGVTEHALPARSVSVAVGVKVIVPATPCVPVAPDGAPQVEMDDYKGITSALRGKVPQPGLLAPASMVQAPQYLRQSDG